MEKKQTITTDTAGIGRGMDFIEQELRHFGLEKRAVHDALLAAEETMVTFAENADENNGKGNMEIRIRRFFGTVAVRIVSPGREIDPTAQGMGMGFSMEEADVEAETAIRGMVMHALEDKLQYQYVKGRSIMTILVKRYERGAL